MDSIDISNVPGLKPIVIIAHEKHPTCPKCGLRDTGGPLWYRYLLSILTGRRNGAMNTFYCEGGQEPEKKVAIETPFGSTERKVEFHCAGLQVEHLHVSCPFCGYLWFMEPRDKKAR